MSSIALEPRLKSSRRDTTTWRERSRSAAGRWLTRPGGKMVMYTDAGRALLAAVRADLGAAG
jgi:hypothetical protein